LENVLRCARPDLDEIPTQSLIALVGDNASGKSRICESICFALFARTFSLGPDELGKVIR
jgi:exonuclease SbcC